MEKINKTIRLLLIVSALVATAACGKKGSSNNTTGMVVPNVCQNCANIVQPVLLANFVSQASNQSVFPVQILSAQMFGSYNGVTGVASNPINLYNGNISAQGVFRVASPIYDSYGACPIAAGDYPLTTVSNVLMNNGMFNTLDLAAGTIRLQITSGVMYKENEIVRMSGQLRIVSVNGVPCAPFGTSIL